MYVCFVLFLSQSRDYRYGLLDLNLKQSINQSINSPPRSNSPLVFIFLKEEEYGVSFQAFLVLTGLRVSQLSVEIIMLCLC